MKEKPKYLVTYQCKTCGEKSNFVDDDEPRCRFCDESEGMEMVIRQEITPELLEAQLKASMERTFSSLQSAFSVMTEEDKAAFGDTDAEKEMLLLLARVKKMKEDIDGLDLKKPEKPL